MSEIIKEQDVVATWGKKAYPITALEVMKLTSVIEGRSIATGGTLPSKGVIWSLVIDTEALQCCLDHPELEATFGTDLFVLLSEAVKEPRGKVAECIRYSKRVTREVFMDVKPPTTGDKALNMLRRILLPFSK
jgi:hypothetical protein